MEETLATLISIIMIGIIVVGFLRNIEDEKDFKNFLKTLAVGGVILFIILLIINVWLIPAFS